jgi:hypothetical protein
VAVLIELVVLVRLPLHTENATAAVTPVIPGAMGTSQLYEVNAGTLLKGTLAGENAKSFPLHILSSIA